MADTQGLRKRTPGQPANEPKTNPVKPSPTVSPFRFRILVANGLFAIALLVYYLYSTLSSIGWEPTPEISHKYQPKISADVGKQNAVIGAFRHAWLAYERDAMGDDEYHPISRRGSNLTSAGGIGYTVIDSLDTMLIMGLTDEYERARDWVAKNLTFKRNGDFNTFETTIRVLGGLLSAHVLSGGDQLYLDKALDLADRILPAFDASTGFPSAMVNLEESKGVRDPHNPGIVSTSEVSTLQLEFRYLSVLTDDVIYWKKVEKIMATIKAARMSTGLASIFMNMNDGKFVVSEIRLGSRGDSYYEYLLKQYLQTNRTEPVYLDMYEDAMRGVHNHLIRKTESQMTYTAELIPERNSQGEVSWRLRPKQDHLVCFLAGSLMQGAIASTAGLVSIPPRLDELPDYAKRDWETGVELLETCMRTHDTQTGLSPEIVHFRTPDDGLESAGISQAEWYIKGARPDGPTPYDARYILRPETVESLFIAFRLTGDDRYRQYGWRIFQAIEKHCYIESGGYASVLHVDQIPVEHDDKMETFLMSETLKYLYLLFSDADLLPLDEYVFNTEAHPLPIFTPDIPTGFY